MRPFTLTLIAGLLACLQPRGSFSAEPTAQQPTLAPPQTAGQPIEERLARLEMQLQLIQRHLGLRYRLPPATSGADSTLPDQSTDYDRLSRLERKHAVSTNGLKNAAKTYCVVRPAESPRACSRSACCTELDRHRRTTFRSTSAILRPTGPCTHFGSVPDRGSLSSIARATKTAWHELLAMDRPRLRNVAGDQELTPPLRPLINAYLFVSPKCLLPFQFPLERSVEP